jgi:hypothetical protein
MYFISDHNVFSMDSMIPVDRDSKVKKNLAHGRSLPSNELGHSAVLLWIGHIDVGLSTKKIINA